MTRTYQLEMHIEEPGGLVEFMVAHNFGESLDATNESRDRMHVWCTENFGEEDSGDRWCTSSNNIFFIFHRPSDATLFKLTWG